MSMMAFFNDGAIKAKYLNRVKAHAAADEIIKGQYWENGKGCAVGCTIHSGDHASYETELGVPEWLARLEDTLFENLPNERSKVWPLQFLEAINVGSDLEKIKTPFIVFILRKNLETLRGLKVDEKHTEVIAAIQGSIKATEDMIHAHEYNLDLSAAESAAWSAAWSARAAARSAESAAESAESAARSAEAAAWSAEAAAWSAEAAAYVEYADKLLEMMRECK